MNPRRPRRPAASPWRASDLPSSSAHDPAQAPVGIAGHRAAGVELELRCRGFKRFQAVSRFGAAPPRRLRREALGLRRRTARRQQWPGGACRSRPAPPRVRLRARSSLGYLAGPGDPVPTRTPMRTPQPLLRGLPRTRAVRCGGGGMRRADAHCRNGECGPRRESSTDDSLHSVVYHLNLIHIYAWRSHDCYIGTLSLRNLPIIRGLVVVTCTRKLHRISQTQVCRVCGLLQI